MSEISRWNHSGPQWQPKHCQNGQFASHGPLKNSCRRYLGAIVLPISCLHPPIMPPALPIRLVRDLQVDPLMMPPALPIMFVRDLQVAPLKAPMAAKTLQKVPICLPRPIEKQLPPVSRGHCATNFLFASSNSATSLAHKACQRAPGGITQGLNGGPNSAKTVHFAPAAH